jgi:hypothetical protein
MTLPGKDAAPLGSIGRVEANTDQFTTRPRARAAVRRNAPETSHEGAACGRKAVAIDEP